MEESHLYYRKRISIFPKSDFQNGKSKQGKYVLNPQHAATRNARENTQTSQVKRNLPSSAGL